MLILIYLERSDKDVRQVKCVMAPAKSVWMDERIRAENGRQSIQCKEVGCREYCHMKIIKLQDDVNKIILVLLLFIFLIFCITVR